MASIKQKIFKSLFVEELKRGVLTGETLTDYYRPSVHFGEECILEMPTFEVDGETNILPFSKGGRVTDDVENAIALYEAYSHLNETQASDPRLWTYLAHVTYRDYVQARWPLVGTAELVGTDSAVASKVTESIMDHWFVSERNDRTLRRHALARLWWAVHLTISPWIKEPVFFADLEVEDAYRFTRVLLSKQDIYQQLLERSLGRDRRLLITMLEYIEKNSLTNRENIRPFVKDLNLNLSVSNFSILERAEMKKVVFTLGDAYLPPYNNN